MTNSRGVERLRKKMCHYCGTEQGVTIDHVIPRVLGGPYNMWNLVPACHDCNHEKSGDWPTCSCSLCQRAITKFSSDHERMSEALRRLAVRPSLVTASIEKQETDLARTRVRLEYVQNQYDTARAEMESRWGSSVLD